MYFWLDTAMHPALLPEDDSSNACLEENKKEKRKMGTTKRLHMQANK